MSNIVSDIVSDIIKEIKPVPYLKGRTRRAHLMLNEDFIRQCHAQDWSLMEIAAAIGLTGKKETLTSLFVSYEMGRKHMGFPRLSPKNIRAATAFDHYRQRVQKDSKDTLAQMCLRNADLIKDLHQAGISIPKMALIFDVSYGSFNVSLQKIGLNRKALSLAQAEKSNDFITSDQMAARWTARQDAHIRRGHACGLPPQGIGGICGRQAPDVHRRAEELGLGPWVIETDSRQKLRRVRAYDAAHDVKTLEYEGAARPAPRPRGLRADAPYAR